MADPNKLTSTYKRLAPQFAPLMYNALDEEIGVLVRTDNRAYLVNILGAVKALADGALDELMILQPSDDTIFIAKKATELEE